MNLIHLINKLEAQKEAIMQDIKTLRKYTETDKTAKKILNGSWSTEVKKKNKKKSPYNKNNPHWMQLPENRARVVKLAKLRAAKRKS